VATIKYEFTVETSHIYRALPPEKVRVKDIERLIELIEYYEHIDGTLIVDHITKVHHGDPRVRWILVQKLRGLIQR